MLSIGYCGFHLERSRQPHLLKILQLLLALVLRLLPAKFLPAELLPAELLPAVLLPEEVLLLHFT